MFIMVCVVLLTKILKDCMFRMGSFIRFVMSVVVLWYIILFFIRVSSVWLVGCLLVYMESYP